MCIITYSPAGIAIPSRDVLETCWYNNPDGAGYMYVAEDTVHVHKGFMSFPSLMDSLASVDTTNAPVVIHFRIGTQGANDAGNTHPFPVTDKGTALTARRSRANVALAHNGIIPLTSDTTQYRNEKGATRSDTFYFVRDYASLICSRVGWNAGGEAARLLARLAKSRLAILSADGTCELIGDFTLDGGTHFSNTTYRARWYETPTFGASSSRYANDWLWGDDDDDALGNIVPIKTVRAAFVPTDRALWIQDDADGSLYDADDDVYLHDATGGAYLYDDRTNRALPLPDCTVIDGAFAPVPCDDATAIFFEVGSPFHFSYDDDAGEVIMTID